MSGFIGNGDIQRVANIHAIEFWRDFVPDGQGGQKEAHFVKWAKRGDLHYYAVDENIARLRKPRANGNGGSEDYDPVWLAIEPSYEAWLKGQAAPINGAALEAWPALTKRQIKVLRDAGYAAIEDVAAMIDSDIHRVKLPDTRKIRDLARAYVENKNGSAHIEIALAKRDEEIADLRAQLNEAIELLRQPAPVG